MDVTTIDFETYYDRDYSLSKLRTDAYVYDDRFEIIMAGVRLPNGVTQALYGSDEEIAKALRDMGVESGAICCHNAHFDGFILTQRLGIRPKQWIDTLSLARAHYPYLRSHSLANLAKALDLGEKGTEVVSAIGKRRRDFSPQGLAAYEGYCLNDVELTYRIAQEMLDITPVTEMWLVDMTVRMFTEPRFVLDADTLYDYWQQEVNRKQTLLDELGLDATELRSNQRFAALLEQQGVIPPVKMSATTGKMTYAFAKTDKDMTDLLDSNKPKVRALVAARLGVKSSIAETRARNFYETSQQPGGKMPIHLNYWGAKTTGRWSGGNKMNAQNLPNRGDDRALRTAMQAPPGYKVVVGDSSNIELRVAMALSGQDDVLAAIERGEDLYCAFASRVFRRTITPEDARERHLGKTAMLLLQYGAGAAKYADTVRLSGTRVSEDEAKYTVNVYREVHSKVCAMWRHLDSRVLPAILNGQHMVSVDVNSWMVTVEEGVAVPRTLGVQYKGLKHDHQEGWSYQMGKSRPKLYGGKVLENISQHIARHIVMSQALLVHTKYPVSLVVHDEVVCVVPEDQADACAQWMKTALTKAPVWCKGQIPLKGEVGIGDNYGDAK